MCTVFAYSGRRLDRESIARILKKSSLRGPDDQRIQEVDDGVFMAFQRLAIMGLDESGMQPFQYEGMYSITNGELYGFRKEKERLESKGYRFSSGSDCELVLPLFIEHDTDAFNQLDAEFATVIYEKGRGLIAARDPIGIRPLFYGYDEDGAIAFASEARLLIDFCREVHPFPPGHFYADGRFECYRDISSVSGYSSDDEETAARKIREKLIAAVEKRLDADAPLGFLLSGGLDSSLVASIASRLLGKKIRTFSIGMDADSIDSRYAEEASFFIGSEHTDVKMSRDEVISALDEVIYSLATYDITTIRASMGMFLLCRYISRNTDVRVLLTGEVSDELFGYKYTDFAPSADAFEKESQKRVRELYAYDVLRADRCIADNSIEARVPFGDLDFASYVLSIEPDLKMNHTGHGKYLLRKAFSEGGWLPEHILWREKAAFSDAVGHSMVDDLKAYAEAVFSGQDLEDEYMKYPEEGRPFTPESLLYRQIFEKHYPGQSSMIPGFWMPNREWNSCDVSDPSARYLPNYGASGS